MCKNDVFTNTAMIKNKINDQCLGYMKADNKRTNCCHKSQYHPGFFIINVAMTVHVYRTNTRHIKQHLHIQ